MQYSVYSVHSIFILYSCIFTCDWCKACCLFIILCFFPRIVFIPIKKIGFVCILSGFLMPRYFKCTSDPCSPVYQQISFTSCCTQYVPQLYIPCLVCTILLLLTLLLLLYVIYCTQNIPCFWINKWNELVCLESIKINVR